MDNLNKLTESERKSYIAHEKYKIKCAIEDKQDREDEKRYKANRRAYLTKINSGTSKRNYYSNFSNKWLQPLTREEFIKYRDKEISLGFELHKQL